MICKIQHLSSPLDFPLRPGTDCARDASSRVETCCNTKTWRLRNMHTAAYCMPGAERVHRSGGALVPSYVLFGIFFRAIDAGLRGRAESSKTQESDREPFAVRTDSRALQLISSLVRSSEMRCGQYGDVQRERSTSRWVPDPYSDGLPTSTSRTALRE